jgi:hypothetical protein
MTEDSGAFKTNLRIRAGFRHNTRIRTCVTAMSHRLETIGVDRWDGLFLIIVPEALRVF